MARGFDTVYGSGSTDTIELAFNSSSSTRSYAVWGYFDLLNANDRLFAKDETNGGLYYYNSGTWEYFRAFSGANGRWSFSYSTTDQWDHICMTYDSSSVSNDPIMYLNGVDQSATEVSTPTGSVNTTTDNYSLGNRLSDNARVMSGMLAEWAIWDRILTAGEVAALADGYSPLFMPDFVCYLPMIRENIDYKNADPTLTGTAVQNHPSVIYPSTPFYTVPVVAAPPAQTEGPLVKGRLIRGGSLSGSLVR